MNNKKYELALGVITIFTVIVTAVGVSFAYFTATMTGTPADVSGSSATVGGITFDGGADFTTADEIEPNWSEEKTFTITAAPSDKDQTILVKLKYTNNMPDLNCVVGEISDGAKGDIEINFSGEETTVVLVEKIFPASTTTQTATYTLTMSLPETGKNQNASQGKTFDGLLFAELSGGMYYNADNPNGTNILPGGTTE